MPSRLIKAERSRIAVARFRSVVAALTRLEKRFEARLVAARDRATLVSARKAAVRLS